MSAWTAPASMATAAAMDRMARNCMSLLLGTSDSAMVADVRRPAIVEITAVAAPGAECIDDRTAGRTSRPGHHLDRALLPREHGRTDRQSRRRRAAEFPRRGDRPGDLQPGRARRAGTAAGARVRAGPGTPRGPVPVLAPAGEAEAPVIPARFDPPQAPSHLPTPARRFWSYSSKPATPNASSRCLPASLLSRSTK